MIIRIRRRCAIESDCFRATHVLGGAGLDFFLPRAGEQRSAVVRDSTQGVNRISIYIWFCHTVLLVQSGEQANIHHWSSLTPTDRTGIPRGDRGEAIQLGMRKPPSGNILSKHIGCLDLKVDLWKGYYIKLRHHRVLYCFLTKFLLQPENDTRQPAARCSGHFILTLLKDNAPSSTGVQILKSPSHH